MPTKQYVNAVVPSTGRRYSIVDVGNGQSTITDVTEYEVQGTPFGAADIMDVGCIEFSCAKSGTVYQLSSPNASAVNIRFVADAAFADGDTFTVNGTPVTAQTTAGDSLPAGCIDIQRAHLLQSDLHKTVSLCIAWHRKEVLYYGKCNTF